MIIFRVRIHVRSEDGALLVGRASSAGLLLTG
jgi:hypothetical protein